MSSRTMLRHGLRPLRSHVLFRRYISTRDMTATDLKKLKVDQSRLMDTLHDTCKWGTGLKWGDNPTDTGMSRLALSDSDKTVRDWFVETTKSLGCKVTIDSIGNIFAIRPGRKDGPPTVAGSHLDTQPTGGRYDGILGIQAGIEMLKILQDHDVETEYPVGVVNWTNEEGARFPISMMASGVWAEAIPEERAHSLKEVSGNATVKSELKRIGYLGDTPASYKAMPIGAHFELHIEQGPILERAGKNIGVVQGVQAYKWFTIDITGRDAHTGSTPFSDRADALLLAARLITHSHRLATKHKALASTGILNLTPGSTNTIPGHVSFTLDIRSPSDETVEKLEEELRRDFDLLAQGTDVDGLLAGSTPALPLSLKWRTDTISTATKFHPDCIQAVRESAESILGKDAAIDISSGAGHDSVYTNKHCPTTMIFIPCKGGVSHNPEEYSSPEECAIGAEVLCQAVVRYDQKRV
ncbi:related to n-carbamoyl-l-amino acid hydrolase [Fusarium oxysporum]|uniref:Related to n-carbamoyl-l-amino acid hydrolase n=1 Tax=Fusarium oxysporum TaxID=5507 RepID=A0A2H3TSU0_FUSOX|nr:related to n-carbamoyl-l-amino acid hydrolase [Fusarium oxysporum]